MRNLGIFVIFGVILSLRGHFVIKGSFSSFSSFFKKTSKISTNTYRTKLNLCGLNSMGNTLKFKYK